MDERIKKQLEFILTIDQVKNIMRQTHLSYNERKENDAEHSWHLAIMAYLLKEYANEEVDACKVMIMCLIHDVVEVYAGDTYCYDEVGKQSQKQREDEAKEKIFSLLPIDQYKEFIALFDEFEENKTPEARFAHVLDRLQPLLLNHSNEGRDWKEHDIKASQVYQRQSQTHLGSIQLSEIIKSIIQENIDKGNLKE